jgi:hypothetical protein
MVQAAVAQIETCNATRQDYRSCATPAILSNAGLPWGRAPGQVTAAAPTPTSYEVLALSAAPFGPRGRETFSVYKDSSGMTRACSPAGGVSCSASGRW